MLPHMFLIQLIDVLVFVLWLGIITNCSGNVRETLGTVFFVCLGYGSAWLWYCVQVISFIVLV